MRAEEMNVVDAAIAYYQDDSAADNHNALMDAVQKLIFSCPQCNTSTHTCPGCGTDIGHFEEACERCSDDSTSLVVRGETPEESAAIVDGNLRAVGRSGLEPPEPEPEYVPAEWQHVLAGDRVRLGTQEAEVTRSSVGTWHADNSDRYRPRPWKHVEVSISLAHLDRSLIMAPGGPVEILADRERAAVLVLQKAFPAVA